MRTPLFVVAYFSFNTLEVVVAKAAPTRGASMKTHTCSKALPPNSNAGARLRAGLTEVPV